MPRKTTILIVILALITGVLIFLAIRSDKTQEFVNKTLNNSTPTPIVISPYATLSFPTQEIDLSGKIGTQSVDVMIDTNSQPVAGVQVELSYDPTILTNMRTSSPITPILGAKPLVLINKVDPTQGRISYAAGITATNGEVNGRGSIVTLSFTVNSAKGVPLTQISFLPKSMVTSLLTPESVLKSSTPLKIILTAQDLTPPATQ